MDILKIDLDTTVDEVSEALEKLAEASAHYLTREIEYSLSDIDSLFKEFKTKLKEARKKGETYRASLSSQEEPQDEG